METVGKAVVSLYKQTHSLRDFGFREQLTRSGSSIASNIAEGFERVSKREIARFLVIAKGSTGELRTKIYIGIDAGFLPPEPGFDWIKETKQIGKILGALIRKYRNE